MALPASRGPSPISARSRNSPPSGRRANAATIRISSVSTSRSRSTAMPCGRACDSSIWQVTDMKVWHVLKQEWHWLWQGRFPVAAILFLLPTASTAFGIIYYQNSVERIPPRSSATKKAVRRQPDHRRLTAMLKVPARRPSDAVGRYGRRFEQRQKPWSACISRRICPNRSSWAIPYRSC